MALRTWGCPMVDERYWETETQKRRPLGASSGDGLGLCLKHGRWPVRTSRPVDFPARQSPRALLISAHRRELKNRDSRFSWLPVVGIPSQLESLRCKANNLCKWATANRFGIGECERICDLGPDMFGYDGNTHHDIETGNIRLLKSKLNGSASAFRRKPIAHSKPCGIQTRMGL